MSKKSPLLLFFLIFFLSILLFLNFKNEFLPDRLLPDKLLPNYEKKEEKVIEKGIVMEYDCQSGKSAFEVLEEKASDVEFKGSSFGRMVTGINGIKQGSGKYWLYFINGKDATVSADSYICIEEEKIKWELK